MKVKFIPQNIEVEATPDKTLLQLANENNIEIRSICKGVPSCAECRVNIVAGEHNIVAPSKAELALIGTSYYIDSRRLSCQVRCFGDVTVDLTEQVERAANQTKKVRGYRTSRSTESIAVQDTMILNEKMEVEKTPPMPTSQQDERPQQQQPPRQQQQGRRNNSGGGNSQGGGGNRAQNQQNNQKRPQGNNNNRPHAQAKGGSPKTQQPSQNNSGQPKKK